MEDALAKVAERFPDSKFAIIDAVVDKPNVASLVFKEHEGSFLAGVVAGLMTKTNNVGFVGGMDIPLIHRFEVGYVEGVKYANPNAEVQISYTGADPSAFNNPGRGKELTLAQINAGADIVYHAAGGTGQGVIEACKEKGKYAIGVDSDQKWIAPDTVITSMLKRVDVAVYETVKAVVEDRFKGGVTVFGVAENGVGVGEYVPEEVKGAVAEAREKIISGEIKVTDYMAQ
jgi:basic membrane protein A